MIVLLLGSIKADRDIIPDHWTVTERNARLASDDDYIG